MPQDVPPTEADEAEDALEEAAADTTDAVIEMAGDPEGALRGALRWLDGVVDSALSPGGAYQLAALIGAVALAWLLTRRPTRWLKARAEAPTASGLQRRIDRTGARILWPAATVLLLWIATAAFAASGLPYGGLRIIASLLNAFIVVRAVTGNVASGLTQRIIAVAAWATAALYILRLLDPVVTTLQANSFRVAGVEITWWRVVTGIVVAAVALWAGRRIGELSQDHIKANANLTPSLAGLLGQIARAAILLVAVIVAISALGVPLTALTVFGGALGIGIGFGLQSVFENLAAGVIILMERSVKVGDFIELASGTAGLVREINVRSTLVTTNDNVDVLVPNKEFVSGQVTNWTLRDAQRRVRVPFGVAYGSDKEVVRQAGLEAAAEVDWVLKTTKGREPQVWMVSMGESSLDFELVVWLNDDAVKKPAKVNADLTWAIHSALLRHDLEIPFPQRDLNIRQPAALRVRVERDEVD